MTQLATNPDETEANRVLLKNLITVCERWSWINCFHDVPPCVCVGVGVSLPDSSSVGRLCVVFVMGCLCVQKWCRPIFELSTNYRELAEIEADRQEEILQRKRAHTRVMNELASEDVARGARLPTRVAFDYAIRPQDEVDVKTDKGARSEPSAASTVYVWFGGSLCFYTSLTAEKSRLSPSVIYLSYSSACRLKRFSAKLQKSSTASHAFTVKTTRL